MAKFALVLLAAALLSAQPAPAIEMALVANGEAGTVTLVDVARRAVVRTIDVNPAKEKGIGPGSPNHAQDTDVSPDGRTLYVSRAYIGDVAAFDIASGNMLWRRSLNTGRADHIDITPDGRHLFVSALMDNRVYKIVAATGELAGHIVSGVYPHDNQVSRDGRLVFNTSVGPIASSPRMPGFPPLTETPGAPFQITIADTATLEVRDRIVLDNAIRPWNFTPDEKGMYVQMANEHAVFMFDLTTKKIAKRLDLPVKPGVTVKDYDFDAPHHGLSLTPDGHTLCLAGRASDYAALVQAPDLTLITTIPVGDGPGWSEVAQNGNVCLVANTRSDDLSILSIPDRREIVRLSMDNGPKHITIARLPAAIVSGARQH